MKKLLSAILMALCLVLPNAAQAQTEWTAPQIPGVDLSGTVDASQTVYMYNVEADAFVTYGMNWGTRAVAVRLYGGDVAAFNQLRSKISKSGTTISVSNVDKGKNIGFANNTDVDVYADVTHDFNYAFTETVSGSRVYTLKLRNSLVGLRWQYGGPVSIDNPVNTTWAFIPETSITDGSYKLYKARKELYAVYNACVNAGFGEYYAAALDASHEVYTTSNDAAAVMAEAASLLKKVYLAIPDTETVTANALFTNANMSGAGTSRDWGTDRSYSYGSMECYHAPFTLTQTHTVPNGKYSVDFHSFYRNDGSAVAPKLSVVGAETKEADVPSIADIDFGSVGGGDNWKDNKPNGFYSAASALGHTSTVATVTDVPVTANSLTITASETGSANWVLWQSFNIKYRGMTRAELLADYPTLRAQVQTWTTKKMSATLKKKFQDALDAAPASLDANSERLTIVTASDGLNTVLNEQTDAATACIAAYEYLARELATATLLGVDVATYQTGYDEGSYDETGANAAAQAVNVASYNQVRAEYTFQRALPDTWEGTIAKTASGQHWSGDGTITYYDANNGWWGANPSLDAAVHTSVTLPAGDYVLMAAGRYENAVMKLFVGDTEVVFNERGDVGYGIDTNGQANFSDEGTYANNDLGFGWEWQYVPFTLAEETTIQLRATLYSNSMNKAWGSFSDLTLYMTKETFDAYAYKDLEEALEKYKPFTLEGDYVEKYNEIKGKYDNKSYADADAIAAAVAELADAYPAYVLANASLEHPADVTEGVIANADCQANDAWPGQGRPTKTGEHWSGDASRIYFRQNVEPDPARVQNITIPHTGLYILKSSVRVADNNSYVEISAGSRKTRMTETTGRIGGTIATDGTEWENVEAGIAAGKSFANGNKGYGWVYNYVYFYAEKDAKLDVSLNMSHGENGREANVGSVQLLYCGENSNYTETVGDLTTLLGKYTAAEMPTITTANVNTVDAALPANAAITSSNPNMLIYAKSGQVANASNVIVDGTCANLVVTDGHPFVPTTGFNATVASYEMTAVASNADASVSFGTLCLPFAVETLPTDAKAYELLGDVVMGEKLVATEVSSIAANTPVIVTKTGTYSGSGAVAAVASDARFTRGQLVGGYTQTTAPERSYVLQKHGDNVAFYLVNDVKPTVNPFRAYIKAQETSEAKLFSIVFDEDGTTAIDGIENSGLMEVERYNATGVRIAAPEKGLNIIRYSNGTTKKVMVK